MAGMLHYLIFATILAVAVSIPNGQNGGGDGAEGIEGPGGANRIQIGNITTITNSTQSGKNWVYCPLTWEYNHLKWTTPDFGISNYPNNAQCSLSGWGWATYAEFTFRPLNLQKKVKGNCVDYFELTFPYGVTKRWCGLKKTMKIKIPTYNYEAKFISDSSITRPGFNMSITFPTSPCHKSVYLYNIGDSGEFSTPNYPSLDTIKRRMCELVVWTQYGNRVQFDFLDFDLNPPCEKNNVVVDMDSQWNYPQSTSYRFCGNFLPQSLTSTWNVAKLVYQANKRNKGFRVRYTVVAGDYYSTESYTTSTSTETTTWPFNTDTSSTV